MNKISAKNDAYYTLLVIVCALGLTYALFLLWK